METEDNASPPAAADASIVIRAGRAQLFDARLKAAPRLSYAINNHRNIRGEKMEFSDKPYLIALFHDACPRITMMSCVQLGKTEMLMVSAFYYSEKGLQVMYVLPDDVLRNTFVANRVDTVTTRVPHYQAQLRTDAGLKTTDSRSLKHFGKGSIFFASSNASSTFIEKPLDVILADEQDKFDQANYEKAEDRLSASPYKIKYEAGNPTVDTHGIAASYRDSDQRAWHIKCERCNEWQPLDWFENIVGQNGDSTSEFRLRDKAWYEGCGRDIICFCRKCAKPLNRLAIGQWVAKYPGRRTHGYHLHQIMAKHVRLDEIFERFRKGIEDDTKMQVFYNSLLGLPYAGAGSKLTDDMLNNCREDYLMPATAEPCIMGVDVGKRLHVKIRQICHGERLRLVFVGTVPQFEDLDALMERYNVISAAVDAMPETRKSQEFVARHPYKAWMVRYQKKLTDIQQNEDTRIISVDRTQAMDRVMAFYKRKAMILPRNAHALDRGDYYRMMKAPTRLYDHDSNSYIWLGDPDHYFHAEVYCLMAFAVRGEFRVWGLNVGQAGVSMAPETEDELLKLFPPGTDKGIIENYRAIYQQMKEGPQPDRMVGALTGVNINGQ